MVAIKGMEMPKNCLACPMYKCEGRCAYCGADFVGIDDAFKKRANCPLVEIVTCKDCKHNYENSCDFDGFGIGDDYFCAKGERKEQ